MNVLIVKTSSLGDIVHTLPALTDAKNSLGNINFDWVTEEGFTEIPEWHPAVKHVIPVAWRRMRKSFLKALFSGELFALIKNYVVSTGLVGFRFFSGASVNV